MSGRYCSVLLTAVIVVLTAAAPAFGQGATLGSISGRVADPSQAPVPDASISVANVKTGVSSSAATTADGYYTVRFLQPGTYSVSVSKTGFQKSVQPSVVVATATSPTVNFTLTLGAVAETVTVTEQVAQLETQTADKGSIIDNVRMANTPTQGHNIMGITWAAAGVTVATNAKSFTPYDNSGSTSISISGGQVKSNEMLIDGVPNRGGSEGGLYGTIPTQESVAEMKVLSSAYSAEYGRTTGGVINITTRSGSNAFHGEGYWFNRNVTMAANTFERNLASQGRLPVHFDQYGFVVNGPIIKNKLFFNFGWGRLHSGTKKSYIGHVPTDKERTGDFSDSWYNKSGVKTLLQIYDPWSIKQDPATGKYSRLPLTGNLIPTSRLNPVGKALWKYIPMPNASGDSITRANNYAPSGGAAKADFSEYNPRVDWNINDRQRLSVRYIRNNFNSYDVEFYPGAADVNTGFPFTRANHNAVFDYTWTTSPTSVLNVRAGIQRYLTANINNKRSEVTPKDLGFSSTFISQASPYFPAFGFGGSPLGSTEFTGAGQGSGNFTPDQINNLDATWSKIIGKHTLKIGGQGRMERYYNVAAGYDAGSFGFGRTATNLDPQVSTAGTGDPVASFLMGVGSASINVQSLPARQSISTAFFVQDDISVTAKLKLNAGLRWDYTGPMTDRYDAMTGIFDQKATSPLAPQVKNAPGASNCPACANLIGGLTFPNVGGMPRNVFDASYKNFGPRIGFAYALNNKTALRGGFGMFFGPIWYDPGQPAGYSQTTSSILYDANQIPINLIDNPFPTGLLKPTGSSLGLATNIGTGVSYVDPHTREPRSYQASFEIQRELPWSSLLSVGYNFNKNDRLPVNPSLNIIPESLFVQGASVLNKQVTNPFAGLVPGYALNQPTIAYSALQVPFPQFTGVTVMNAPIGDSRYDGMQVQLTKRFSRGVSMSVAYTVSKKLGHYGYQNSFDNYLEKTVDPYDIPQAFVPHGAWEMPWGKNRSMWTDMPGWLDHIIGGWQFNWMIRISSGKPFQLGGDTIPVNGVDPNDVPGGQRLDQWINRAAYTLNTDPYRPRRWSAITGRLREPPTHSFDLGIQKNFRITERVKFQLINNWINATNTPQWFGSTGACNTASKSCFGQIAGFQTQSNYPRQVQIAGRITF
jgi:hypothetical protein